MVRSTLASEGYAVSEAIEQAEFVCDLISEITTSPGTQLASRGSELIPLHATVFSD